MLARYHSTPRYVPTSLYTFLGTAMVLRVEVRTAHGLVEHLERPLI